MGDPTPLPNPAAVARAELFTREQFVYEGEGLEEALALGSPRRKALDAALKEVEAGNKQPSIEWRQRFSLLLGLERVLSEEEPHLVDGTVLSAHQVDALSGTLTALLAEIQRNGSAGNGAAGSVATNGSSANGAAVSRSPANGTAPHPAPARLASPAIPSDEDADTDPDSDEEEFDLDSGEEPDEEPQDWQDEDELDEDVQIDE